jgi:flagellar biosynthesis protein FliR
MLEFADYAVWAPTLLLVIVRVAGIFVTAPLLSDPSIPAAVKAMVSVVIGLAVTARLSSPVPMPDDWTSLVLSLGGEMLIGGILGYTTSLLLTGLEIAGEQIGQQMGIALAEVFNPLTEATTNVIGQLVHMTGLAVFLLIGGHRMMLHGLMETFSTVPLLGYGLPAGLVDVTVALMTGAFILSLKVAAPVLVAMLLTELAMGLIQRTMPQFNILSTGFQVRVAVAGTVLAVGVTTMGPLIEQAWAVASAAIAGLFP